MGFGLKKNETAQNASTNEKVTVMNFTNIENDVEATKITSTMQIDGNIRSEDSIYTSGKIFGNVTTSQVFSSTNLTVGDIEADAVSLNAGRVKGNIKANDKINVGLNSVVVGDIKCDEVLVSGKVKGNLDIKNCVSAQSESLIVGDVIAESISAEQGARLNGNFTMRKDDNMSIDMDAEFDLGGDF